MASELGKIGGAYGRGCLLQLLVVPAVFLAFLAIFGLPVCAGMIHEDLAAPTFWCLFLSFPPFVVVTSLVVGLSIRGRNLRILDAAMEGFGRGQNYMMSGRQWSVDRGGRKVSAWFIRGTFVMTVPGAPGIDVQLGRDNALARVAGQAAGRVRRELPDGVVAFGADEAGLDAFLASPGVVDAATTLCAQDGRSLRSVAIRAGRDAQLTTRHLPATQMARATDLADALARLVEAAEGLPT